jgi:hypothetical protein
MMIETPVLSTYQPSTRFTSTSIGTPLGITHRAYRNPGILPKSFTRNTTRISGSGNSYSSPTPTGDLLPAQEDYNGISKGSGNATVTSTDEPLLTSVYSSRFPRRTNFNHDRKIVMTNPFKLESDSMEAYIRSRKPILDGSNEKTDGGGTTTAIGRPVPVETISQDTRPTYSIRNMPLRNLDELRETIAIRRNYSKDRALGNTYSYGLEIPTPPDSTASLLLYSPHKSEDSERSRSRLSTSPYSRPQSRLTSEEKTTPANLDDKSSDGIEKPTE